MESQAEYNAVQAINNTGMTYLAKSPAHYKAWLDSKQVQTAAQTFGIAVHCAILEPARFAVEYASMPDTSGCKTPAQKAAMTKAVKKEYEGYKTLLSFDDFTAIQNMKDAVISSGIARNIIQDAEKEYCMYWDDSDSGAKCKGRADLIIKEKGIIADIKTTNDASPGEFSYFCRKYNSYRQAAFYLDGAKMQEFIFIAIEKTPPYGVGLYRVTDDLINSGRWQYKSLCVSYAACVTAKVWPSYPNVIIDLD